MSPVESSFDIISILQNVHMNITTEERYMNDNKRKRCLSSTDNECSKSQRTIQTLRELIPPKHKKTSRSSAAAIPPPCISPIHTNELLDWTAVITRVNSHPHEAAESYFRQSSSSSSDDDDTTPTYKPLHAMLKYNPPLSAVEAVLKAHPIAALDHTFEGTALKIAVESGVKSMPVLRLLLIAELAMSKKECSTATKNDDAATSSSSLSQREEDGSTMIPTQSSSKDVYTGHNPIRWISESHIPRKTAALLLKWYPNGAFQRPSPQQQQQHQDDDDGDDDANTNSMLLYSDSPLIEIIDDFASDQDAVTEDDDDDHADDDDESEESDGDELLDNVFNDGEYSSLLPRRRRTFAEREHLRKERRWEKFLHILYATDKMLSSMKSLSSAEKDTNTASADASDTATSAQTNIPNNVSSTESLSPATTFHPVHAWIRCLTNPNLGLENCRPYGVWSILRAMGQRIPSEFTAKDRSHDNRTAFQTLAENPVSHCRLCTEEIRDIVECLLDADYRSAYLPRKSDGRLVIHVALENGWPCRDLFSRKLSATCA